LFLSGRNNTEFEGTNFRLFVSYFFMALTPTLNQDGDTMLNTPFGNRIVERHVQQQQGQGATHVVGLAIASKSLKHGSPEDRFQAIVKAQARKQTGRL
jgi:hypothetical protein